MRRSVEAGMTSRFVTGERVEALLKVIHSRRASLTAHRLYRKCPTLQHLVQPNTWMAH